MDRCILCSLTIYWACFSWTLRQWTSLILAKRRKNRGNNPTDSSSWLLQYSLFAVLYQTDLKVWGTCSYSAIAFVPYLFAQHGRKSTHFSNWRRPFQFRAVHFLVSIPAALSVPLLANLETWVCTSIYIQLRLAEKDRRYIESPALLLESRFISVLPPDMRSLVTIGGVHRKFLLSYFCRHIHNCGCMLALSTDRWALKCACVNPSWCLGDFGTSVKHWQHFWHLYRYFLFPWA